MQLPARTNEVEDSPGPLPREFARIMRPEIPGLIKEIGVEVTRAFPEYAGLLDGPDEAAIRQGVEKSLNGFVDRVADPGASTASRDELLRKFGRVEAYEGRDLNTLQSAYRLGARVALRRAKSLGRRFDLSPELLLTFAEALFSYIGELEALSLEGYMEARAGAGGEMVRRRLLHLLLAGTPLHHATINDLCEQACWQVPDEVTMVALRAPAPEHTQAGLAADVLPDLGAPQPHFLVPGPLTPERHTMLETAVLDGRLAIGLTVPTAHAADSLRWARRVLQLVDEGVVPDTPYLRTADHLMALWLLSDLPLVREVAQRELSPLAKVSGTRRTRLVETLHAWLTTRGTADQVGDALGVHAQTVRYRLRNLEAHFGHRLEDPGHRFAMEAALRALHLHDATGPAGGTAADGTAIASARGTATPPPRRAPAP
ncbi:helix-turn-helix domain-containing protein [Streptomyces sp. DSM 41982]|uniref:Helix-turn-helix domain-containing protein n=1 Tax=Streptomyces evansiae TaxID=3075535 RepID=A0ABD5E0U0_9ACTN|nr:helix-turn-helix domain-containing protein [Streptomyces sp. DSM 41982]MDT0415069.1 helix-turn-helix domain-containing protein [Streptomyces sp. DSM 41982]